VSSLALVLMVREFTPGRFMSEVEIFLTKRRPAQTVNYGISNQVTKQALSIYDSKDLTKAAN
jgi:hypothetical protein